jgi:hypothetical protein
MFDGGLALANSGTITAADTANLGLTLTGNKGAADAGTDITLRSAATRTDGNLLVVSNAGSTRFRVTALGNIALGGTGGAITATDTANLGLTLTGNKDAADAGADVVVQSTATRTAGNLLSVLNGGAARFRVMFDGGLALANSGTITAADTANLGLTLTGNKGAADAGADVVVQSTNARTAGNILQVKNNGVTFARFRFDGSIKLEAPTEAAIFAGATNACIRLYGNKNAADAGADVVVDTVANRTAGAVLDVRNFGASLFQLTTLGHVYLYASVDRGLVHAGANCGLQYFGNKNAADAGSDHTFSTFNVRTAGKLLDVTNNGASKFAVNYNGALTGPSGVALAVWNSVAMTGDVSFAVTTATNLTGLTFACASGKTYRWRAVLYNAYTNAAVGIAFGTAAGPTTSIFNLSFWSKDNVGTFNQLTATAFNALTAANAGHSAQMYVVEGIFTTTGAGTFQLTAAAETAAAGNVIKAGSYLEWMEA